MPVSIFDILRKGTELANKDPEVQKEIAEFDGDKICYKFTDDVPVTMITDKGKIVVESGESPESQVVVELSALSFCDVLDKTIDRTELRNKSKLIKGELHKLVYHILAFVPFFNAMVRYYSENSEFRKMVDERKARK